MNFFQISSLDYSYGDEKILKNINLTYDSSDFLSIIGPNGAGKSTLIRLILGLLDNKGSVKFSNIKKNQIGYVPQLNIINSNFPARVIDIVLMGFLGKKIFGFYTKNDTIRAIEALEKVQMSEFGDKKITELSGGQRQRVFIARALAGECKMLILDEPTASVDSKGAVAIFELLSHLHAQGIGILLVCHDINLVLAYSDKIAYLDRELFLHENSKEARQSAFFKHLYERHSHFCAVEMSKNFCEECGNFDCKNSKIFSKFSSTKQRLTNFKF